MPREAHACAHQTSHGGDEDVDVGVDADADADVEERLRDLAHAIARDLIQERICILGGIGTSHIPFGHTPNFSL